MSIFGLFQRWRLGHAYDPMARFERRLKLMAEDIMDQIEQSVGRIVTAIENHAIAVSEVANAIRNHPASTTDNGRLVALASRLDDAATSLNNTTSELTQLSSATAAADPVETSAPAVDGESTGISSDGTLTQQVGGDVQESTSDTTQTVDQANPQDGGGDQPPADSTTDEVAEQPAA